MCLFCSHLILQNKNMFLPSYKRPGNVDKKMEYLALPSLPPAPDGSCMLTDDRSKHSSDPAIVGNKERLVKSPPDGLHVVQKGGVWV